ncbi:hypothetical protein PS925_05555 [Pseudomonas fluorescens]|uniref:HipA-like C-terminal domain-containing protein n=1 Tax=Pseudomonas fluorescens TaxID=294 RepID=A0A5E7VPG8_PSEFL|nr:hypothetical protein PS925_05555 [Pseudomonas fluorescens]
MHVPIELLASEVQEVLKGKGGELLQKLLLIGGSPQGARPKALVYRDPHTDAFTTAATPGFEAWLVKFPAQQEHPEVCAIEMVYAECLRLCGIQTPDTRYFSLSEGMAAFVSAMAESLYPGVITQETLRTIQQRIDQNIGLLA